MFDFIKAMYDNEGWNVEAIVDVWCEAPVQKFSKTFVDSARGRVLVCYLAYLSPHSDISLKGKYDKDDGLWEDIGHGER